MPDDEPVLTEEEVQILRLVAEGLTDNRIARELGLSRTTVHRRLHRVAEALQATSRINLVLRAVEAGIILNPGRRSSPEGAENPQPGPPESGMEE